MSLDEIITTLAAEDPNRVLPYGFDNPHSYRGYYTDLAFEPATDITVGDMLEAARNALGHTYTGWKGGEFRMSGYSDCWLSMEGSASGESIGPLLLKLMLAAGKDGPVPAPLDARRAEVLAEAIRVAQSAPTPDCSNFSSLNDAFNGGQNVAVQAIRELAGDVDEDSCATCSHTDDYHYPDCMHIACDCAAFVRRDAA